MAKQTQIIDKKIQTAANQLVFTLGYRGWNMNDCAEAAGITKRTLYKYIDSKEKLILNTLEHFILSIQEKLFNIAIIETDYLKALYAMVDIFPQLIKRMDTRAIAEIFKEYPDIEKRIIQERIKLTEHSIQFIRKGQQIGIISSASKAETIVEIIQSIVLYYVKSDPDNMKTKIKSGLNIVIKGILL